MGKSYTSMVVSTADRWYTILDYHLENSRGVSSHRNHL